MLVTEFSNFLAEAGNIIWGPPMLVFLVGTGILLTLRLKFYSLTSLPYALKLAFSRNQDTRSEGDVSHFQALMTALAATIGTGNIAGVATAVALGGPGAVFWMWITALVGLATKYGEAILAVKYRTQDDRGNMAGGPMYYIEKGLGLKWLGTIFAMLGALAGFGIGNMVQTNSVAEAVNSTFAVPNWITGIVLAVLTALVIIGGIKNIGKVAGILVPVMAIFYVLGGLIIIFLNIERLPEAIMLILQSAFSGQAATGGFAGASVMMAMRYGVARGVFSNEAGLGSAPIAAAAAKTDHPGRQALVSMTGTFLDTIVVCSITGLVLAVTGAWDSGKTGATLTTLAFESALPNVGSYIVAIGIILFAYSTVLGWAYYGEKCAEYIFGTRILMPYRWLWVIAAFAGTVMKLPLVWDIADVLNGLMAVPNLIALVGLSGVIVKETESFKLLKQQEEADEDLTEQEA